MAENSCISMGFEKLAGRENFNDWKFGMKMALVHSNLWVCIDGYPEGDTTATDAKVRADQKALAKICLMVQPCAYPHVRNAGTAKEAWQNLLKAYEDKGLSRRLGLIRQLVRIKLEEFKTMEQYVNEAMSLAQKLSDMQHPVDDEFLGVILLSGLTPEYDPMVMAIENSVQAITSDFVKTKLLQDDKYNKESYEVALLSKKRTFKKGNKQEIKCYQCGTYGHYKNQCPRASNVHENKKFDKGKCQKDKKEIAKTDRALQVTSDGENRNGSQKWYIDSGATTHMTFERENLMDFQCHMESKILVANNQRISGAGVGKTQVCTRLGLKTISDIVYVPELRANLLSVSKMVGKGHSVVFHNEKCSIYDSDDFDTKGEVVATATLKNGLYELDVEECSLLTSVAGPNSQELWHKRLGHLNRASMQLLSNGMAEGVTYTNERGEQCQMCLLGKQTRQPFAKIGGKRATNILELIHTDLCGPMPVSSWNGARYIFVLVDDYTRKIFVYFLRSKSDVLKYFKEFQAFVENQTGLKIKKVRSDNGTEYCNEGFKNYFKVKGIEHQTTVRYTPQQNGVAERTNRTIVEKARCLLQEANMDQKMWAEAVNTAVYLKNRSPHKAVKDCTPEEKWSGRKINLKHLKVFGCIAHAHVPDQLRKKFDPKSKEYLFVGYDEHTKAYRLFDVGRPGHIVKSRDVVFFENKFTLKENSGSVVNGQTDVLNHDIQDDHTEDHIEPNPIPDQEEEVSVEDIDVCNSDSEADETQEEVPPRRSQRIRKEKTFPDHVLYLVSEAASEEPTTVSEALNGSDAEEWRKAMDEEYTSLLDNEVWSLVDRPDDQKVIQCKWVFQLKCGVNGEKRYKARLVARGFTQQYGVDYTETFSPVVRNSTLRMLFAIAVSIDLKIEHIDVITAFLNSDLKERVFMTQPEGYNQNNKVCLLNKAIYGLKQASRMWNLKVEQVLTGLGYEKSKYESCVYIKRIESTIVIVALYVDDFLLFYNNSKEIVKLKSVLSENFKLKDLGEVRKCLGLNININKSKQELRVNQKHYILYLLEKFGMLDVKPISTPIEPRLKLEKGDHCDENIPYRCLIGSLMFLAVNSRPDIAFSVSYLSQFNTCYTNIHFQHAKRILRYLKGTIDQSLIFKKGNLDIKGFCDADWGNNLIDGKSYTGYLFMLSEGAISWESKKQASVSLSSTEAEYVSICQATKEAIFLKGFLNEILNIDKAILLHNDSQSAQKLVFNPVFHNRTKHINVKYHFIREAVDRQEIFLKYISTNDMPADIFTKGLPGPKHKYFVNCLGCN